MRSRERVLNLISGSGEIDRLPIYLTINGIQPKNVEETSTSIVSTAVPKNENLRKLRNELKERGDLVYLTEFPEFDRRFLLITEENISLEKERRDGYLLKNYKVKTPNGDLNYREKVEAGVDTTWIEDPLLKNRKDAEKILSVSGDFDKDTLDESIKQYKKRVGEQDEWVKYIWVSTPLVCASHMLPMDKFLIWAQSEKELLHQIMSTAYRRIRKRLEYLLEHNLGDIYRFGGSEQATPPMMSPELYDEFVKKYDEKLFDLVHGHGKYVQVHVHGKVGTVLKKMKEMGVDVTDPLEPPPQGDITPKEALEVTDEQMTFVGNIEFRDLEREGPQEIKRRTKDLIRQTEGKKLIVASSANPISGISDELLENYLAMLEAAEESEFCKR